MLISVQAAQDFLNTKEHTNDKCYQFLGLKNDSDIEDVKKAFRKLIIRYHPDKNNNSSESGIIAKAICDAYEQLTKEEKENNSNSEQSSNSNQFHQASGEAISERKTLKELIRKQVSLTYDGHYISFNIDVLRMDRGLSLVSGLGGDFEYFYLDIHQLISGTTNLQRIAFNIQQRIQKYIPSYVLEEVHQNCWITTENISLRRILQAIYFCVKEDRKPAIDSTPQFKTNDDYFQELEAIFGRKELEYKKDVPAIEADEKEKKFQEQMVKLKNDLTNFVKQNTFPRWKKSFVTDNQITMAKDILETIKKNNGYTSGDLAQRLQNIIQLLKEKYQEFCKEYSDTYLQVENLPRPSSAGLGVIIYPLMDAFIEQESLFDSKMESQHLTLAVTQFKG